MVRKPRPGDCMRTPLLTHPRPSSVDFYSLQALLFKEQNLSFLQQTRLFFSFRSRISD